VQNDPANPSTIAVSTSPAIAVTAASKDAPMANKASGQSPQDLASSTLDPDDSHPQSIESKVVNVAQLSGNDAHSEVRIAMQADQLGQVELHATVNGQQVGAAITVEKKEAHAAMAVELPSLQQALEERQLRVSEVVLTQSTLHSTAGDAGNPGNALAEQRRNQAGMQYQQHETESQYGTTPGAILESPGIFDNSGRLSVRA
jgi:flagellar hook-length control protein FliK